MCVGLGVGRQSIRSAWQRHSHELARPREGWNLNPLVVTFCVGVQQLCGTGNLECCGQVLLPATAQAVAVAAGLRHSACICCTVPSAAHGDERCLYTCEFSCGALCLAPDLSSLYSCLCYSSTALTCVVKLVVPSQGVLVLRSALGLQ